MRRAGVIFSLIASLALGGCSDGWRMGAAEASSNADIPRDLPDYLTVARVERGMIRDVIPAMGRIRAADEVEVGAEVSGRVIEVLASFDDPVSAGDVLVRLDPAPFETAVNRAEAQLDTARAARTEAEARLEAVELDLRRARDLLERGNVPVSRVEDLELQVRQLGAGVARADAQVELAQSQLSQARIDLDRTVITAPLDGFVLDRRVEVGQSVNAALSTPVLFVIAANLESVVIDAEVAEADVARIEAGMEVRFTVDAYPGFPFTGEAGGVRRSPTIRNRFVTYIVPIEARDPDQRLLPGMTASVEFVAGEAINELIIPRGARSTGVIRGFEVPEFVDGWIRERYGLTDDEPLMPDYEGSIIGAMSGLAIREGKRYVFVWEDGEVRVKHFVMGAESDTHFAALEGELEEGDWVIVDYRDPVFDDL